MDPSDAPHDEPPLLRNAEQWPHLLDLVGPAWLLVTIRARMSRDLLRRHTPEDVLQEALVHAWRDRARCQWQGVRAFRCWLLQIVDNRLRDLAEAAARHKRGGGVLPHSLPDEDALPPGTTTPGRIASWREHAALMTRALEELPHDLRDVVRLRLFEELEMPAVAAQLAIGLSAAKHRLRKGAEMFRRTLRNFLVASSASADTEDRMP